MPKKVCPNGHIYDSSIYGDECPLCPKGSNDIPAGSNTGGDDAYPHLLNEPASAGTRINPPAGGAAPAAGPAFGMPPADAAGDTRLRHGAAAAGVTAPPVGGRTTIRPPKGTSQQKGRKLVGFLVSYNRNPLGKSYEIYEGKNFVGRDRSCDICIPDDGQISGRHMSILYRNVDNKFKYRDEQSSNGTFVNKELSDEGELQNFDIIRLGGTVFIFIAIPQLG